MKSQIAEFVTESSTAEFKFFVGEGGLFRRNGTPLSFRMSLDSLPDFSRQISNLRMTSGGNRMRNFLFSITHRTLQAGSGENIAR